MPMFSFIVNIVIEHNCFKEIYFHNVLSVLTSSYQHQIKRDLTLKYSTKVARLHVFSVELSASALWIDAYLLLMGWY